MIFLMFCLFDGLLMITLIVSFFRAPAALTEEDQNSQPKGNKDEAKDTTENGGIPKSPKSPDAATLEKILASGADTVL